MIRSTLIASILLATPAAAQNVVCPRMQIGWAMQWPTSQVTSAAYDSGARVIYVIQAHTIPEAYANVPISVINLFSQTQNPYQVYLFVRGQYPQIMLTPKDNCPLLQQDGTYVYTNTVPETYFFVLMKETYGPLLQESGNYLFIESPAPVVAPAIGLAQETTGLIVQENGQPMLLY